jgi:pimeloyl-ACP methyl ester carboxylesterase
MKYDFIDSGTGPALLFLPGSFSSHTAWKGVQKALRGNYRMVTTSLPGYGGTPEIRSDTDDYIELATDFVAEVVARIGGPVHMIGHSYGGLSIYASVLSGKVKPESIVTFEGNPVFSKRAEGSFSWTQNLLSMFNEFEAAVLAGDPDAAGIIIDFWSKPGMFKSMPTAFVEFCRSKAPTNLLDWRTAIGFTPSFSAYECLDMPTTVVHGELANQAMVDVSDQIVANARNAVLHVEPGAGHFLISTHPEACAAVIDSHMTNCSGAR